MWLILGGLILYFGLSAYIWEKINTKHFQENPVTSIVLRSIFILSGVILISSNIPVIFTSVSYPGWMVMGLLTMALSQTPIFWNQFSELYSSGDGYNDKGWLETFYITRFICTLVAIVMIGVGVGNGVPGWHKIPDPNKTTVIQNQ